MPKMIKEVKTIWENSDVHTIDYKTSTNISPSQFGTWSDCRHRWYLDKVKKLSPFEASKHTIFGSAMHLVIQEWLEVMYRDSVKASDAMDLRDNLKKTMKTVYDSEQSKMEKTIAPPSELNEMFLDGVEILSYLKRKRKSYFSSKNDILCGIETDIVQEVKPGVYFKGYIDLVFFNKNTGRYKVIDLKTSTRGWNDYQKKEKSSQIIFYKEMFARQFNVDVDMIDVEYMILRRKVPKDPEYPVRRIQEFKPASGKIKRGKLIKEMNQFLDEAFDNNGKHIDKEYMKSFGSACRWCPFKGTEHCTGS